MNRNQLTQEKRKLAAKKSLTKTERAKLRELDIKISSHAPTLARKQETQAKQLAKQILKKDKKSYSSGGLGIRISEKAHKEGRAAFRSGIKQNANPYMADANKDSDEWLRRQAWHCGYNFASLLDYQAKRKLKNSLPARRLH